MKTESSSCTSVHQPHVRTMKNVLSHNNYQQSSKDDIFGVNPSQSSTSAACQNPSALTMNLMKGRARENCRKRGRVQSALLCASIGFGINYERIRVDGGFLNVAQAKTTAKCPRNWNRCTRGHKRPMTASTGCRRKMLDHKSSNEVKVISLPLLV